MKISYGKNVYGREEINAVLNKLKKTTHMGEAVTKFENKIAKLFAKKYGLMVNSGSSANLLIFQCLINPMVKKLKPGDEVLVSSICWSTSLWPIIQSGLKAKFVDVNLDNLNIDLKDLKKKISRKSKKNLRQTLYRGGPITMPFMPCLMK